MLVQQHAGLKTQLNQTYLNVTQSKLLGSVHCGFPVLCKPQAKAKAQPRHYSCSLSSHNHLQNGRQRLQQALPSSSHSSNATQGLQLNPPTDINNLTKALPTCRLAHRSTRQARLRRHRHHGLFPSFRSLRPLYHRPQTHRQKPGADAWSSSKYPRARKPNHKPRNPMAFPSHAIQPLHLRSKSKSRSRR